MEFLKKHYEKLLLALVLLGLMGAVVYMLIFVPDKRNKMKEMENVRLNPQITPLAKVRPELFDLSAEKDALQRLQSPVKLDFTTGHNLFNPVLWQLQPNGKLRKIQTGNEIGPGALKITAINPIYLIITATNSDSADRYLLDIYREIPGLSRHSDEQRTMISREGTNKFFNLKNITGTPENPKLELEFKRTGEPVQVSFDQPYKRVDGYTADLEYPPEPGLRPWYNLRPGPPRAPTVLTFENASYILVDVQENYIVVLDPANNKKTPIYFHSANSELK